MKKLAILTSVMALSIVASAQNVESFMTKNDNHGNFKSYTFVTDNDNSNPIVLTEEATITSPDDNGFVIVSYKDSEWAPLSAVDQEIIRDALSYELDIRNAKYQQDKPEVLVQVKVYEKHDPANKAYMKALEKYKQSHSEQVDYISGMNTGAVVVSIIDAKTDQNIWEGYAFNTFGKNDSFQKRQHDLRTAIDKIMARYDYDHEHFQS